MQIINKDTSVNPHDANVVNNFLSDALIAALSSGYANCWSEDYKKHMAIVIQDTIKLCYQLEENRLIGLYR